MARCAPATGSAILQHDHQPPALTTGTIVLLVVDSSRARQAAIALHRVVQCNISSRSLLAIPGDRLFDQVGQDTRAFDLLVILKFGFIFTCLGRNRPRM